MQDNNSIANVTEHSAWQCSQLAVAASYQLTVNTKVCKFGKIGELTPNLIHPKPNLV